MANICSIYIVAKSNQKESLNELRQRLKKDAIVCHRLYKGAEITGPCLTDNSSFRYMLTYNGAVPWSMLIGLLGWTNLNEPEGGNLDICVYDGFPFIIESSDKRMNFFDLAEKYKIEFEIFAKESAMEFAEHATISTTRELIWEEFGYKETSKGKVKSEKYQDFYSNFKWAIEEGKMYERQG